MSPLELHDVTSPWCFTVVFSFCNVKVCVKVRYVCSLSIIYNDVCEHVYCALCLSMSAVWLQTVDWGITMSALDFAFVHSSLLVHALLVYSVLIFFVCLSFALDSLYSCTLVILFFRKWSIVNALIASPSFSCLVSGVLV